VERAVAGDTTCLYDFIPKSIYTSMYLLYIVCNRIFGFEIENTCISEFFLFVFVVSLMIDTYFSRNM
jgi:hypothetical protein